MRAPACTERCAGEGELAFRFTEHGAIFTERCWGVNRGLTFRIGFDKWHFWDTPNLFEYLRGHARCIMGVHLSDRRNPTRGWAARVLPGDGTLELAAMLRTLEAAGCNGWDDLEVLSDIGILGNNYPDSLWQVPPVQLVSRARAAFERLWTGRRSDAG